MGETAMGLDGSGLREFRGFVVLSLLLHALALWFLGWTPGVRRYEAPPGVIAVDLVTLPAPARPSPAPAPRPRPKPPAPAPVVLPEEPTRPEPKPEPAPEARPKPEPVEPEAPPEERDYADVLASLRREAGEPEPEAEPAREPAAPLIGGGGPPGGRPLSPEVAAWMRRARIHIRRSWVVPPGFRTESLRTVVHVELDASGHVRGEPEIVERSGNPWYDDGVVRSIQKASPLPEPPEPGQWTFVLLSDEAY